MAGRAALPLRVKLRSKVRPPPQQSPDEEPEPEPSCQLSAAAQRMRKWRARLKSNPEAYKQHRSAEKERGRQYRMSMSEEQRLAQQGKTNERVRRWRQKMKASSNSDQEGKSPNVSRKPKTRNEQKALREKWKVAKATYRENLHPQKKRRLNEKRRKQYHEKNKETQVPCATTPAAAGNAKTGFGSLSTKYRAIRKARETLPNDPDAFATVIDGLLTPKKAAALSEKRVLISPSTRKQLNFADKSLRTLKAHLATTSKQRSKKVTQQRRQIISGFKVMKKYGLVNETSKALGVSWRFMAKCSELDEYSVDDRKERSDALGLLAIEKVLDFFSRDDISRELPGKKTVRVKTMQQKKVLDRSLNRLYLQFQEENPNVELCFSKFAQLRPGHIQLMGERKIDACLCEYCVNIKCKLRTINQIASAKKLPGAKIVDKYDLLVVGMCPKAPNNAYFNRECQEMKCGDCGPRLVKDHLHPLCKECEGQQITWQRWETRTYMHKGKKCSRKTLITKNGHLEELVTELLEEYVTFPMHLFNAVWQYRAFKDLIQDVPTGCVVLCMDFAENYSCLYQTEIQSAHWSHEQATLFPMVAYLKCPNCPGIVNETIAFISSDRKHDSHAVHLFVSLANAYIIHRYNLVINKEIHFSDGASSQFKSKTPFSDVSFAMDDYGFEVEKHYFGSRHGKGPCDGEGGVIKRQVSQAVKSERATVRTALEMFDWCDLHLTKQPNDDSEDVCFHSRRKFFYVDDKDINRNRPERAKPLKGARKLHAVRQQQDGKLQSRNLSCFCIPCRSGLPHCHCQNKSYMDAWNDPMEKAKVKKGRKSRQQKEKGREANVAKKKKKGRSARKTNKSSSRKEDEPQEQPTQGKEHTSLPTAEYAEVETLVVMETSTSSEMVPPCDEDNNSLSLTKVEVDVPTTVMETDTPACDLEMAPSHDIDKMDINNNSLLIAMLDLENIPASMMSIDALHGGATSQAAAQDVKMMDSNDHGPSDESLLDVMMDLSGMEDLFETDSRDIVLEAVELLSKDDEPPVGMCTGDFIVVRCGEQDFVAIVQQIHEERREVDVQYMKYHAAENYFTYKEEVSCQSFSDIHLKLHPPSMDRRMKCRFQTDLSSFNIQ